MAKIGKKSGSTRVATAKFVKIAEQLGLNVVAKAGWLRIEGAEKGQRLLVHTGKKGTNCIELVGFESPTAVAHPCPPAKTMTQLIDFNLPEREILRNTFKTAKLLVAAKVVEAEPVEEAKQEPTEAPVEAPVAEQAAA